MRILNAIPGFGAPLTEQEIKDFLETKILNVHLGTVDEKVMQVYVCVANTGITVNTISPGIILTLGVEHVYREIATTRG